MDYLLNYYALLACIQKKLSPDKMMRKFDLFDAQNYPGKIRKA